MVDIDFFRGMSLETDNPWVLEWLQTLMIKNRSKHTIKAYLRDVGGLLAYLQTSKLAWPDLDRDHIERFIAQRIERDTVSLATVQRELSALRQFYAWLVETSKLEHNPFKNFKFKRPVRALPKMLDVDVITQLLEQPEPKKTRQLQLWRRDKAMLELLYGSGLRVAELAGLDILDADLDQACVRVTGKGNKARLVPMGSKSIRAILTWLQTRTHFKPNSSALFVNQHGNRLTTRGIEQRVSLQARRAGIDTHLYPHLLRHCFASHMLSGSGDLRAVQELLGHENIATTQIYTHLDFTELARIYDNAHPRSKGVQSKK